MSNFNIKEYSDVKLESVDRTTWGSELLLANPLSGQVKFNNALVLRISQIKQYLQTENGHNMNMMEFVLSKSDRNNIQDLVSYVNLFTEQVEKQYELYKDSDIELSNYFVHGLALKEEIIREHYNELVEFLLALNTDELIWGKFTERERTRLYDSLFAHNGLDTIYKTNVISTVAKYTTIDELDSSKSRVRTYNNLFYR